MIRVFTGSCSGKDAVEQPKDENKTNEEQRTINAEAVAEYDLWFASSYIRLRERISLFPFMDEDNFHNTYLLVRDRIMHAGERPGNFEAYFFGCYRFQAMRASREERRYVYPEDDFFLRFGDDGPGPDPGDLNRCERLVKDILSFLRSRFSGQEYRIFMLRYYGSRYSLKLISECMGLPVSAVQRKMEHMMEAVRANINFGRRCDLLYIYE